MTVRTGMAALIAELRTRGSAGTADYQIGTATFWTDAQLQDILDRNRTNVRRELLTREREYSGGSVVYRDYTWAFGPWIEASGDDEVWRVENAAGSAIGTASYDVDYNGKVLRFAENTGGSAYYLTYRTYDLDRAAADLWDAKAASVADRFDLATDNHDLKRSQLVKQYREQADSWRRRAAPRTSTRVRADANDWPGHESW